MRKWLLTTSIYAADGLVGSKQRDDLVSISEAFRFAKADEHMLQSEYSSRGTSFEEEWHVVRVEISIVVAKE